MSDFDAQKGVDPELQEFLMIEKQKAAVAAQVKKTKFLMRIKPKTFKIHCRFTSLRTPVGTNVWTSQATN